MQDRKTLISKHPVFTGYREGETIHQRIRAGDAFLHEGDEYYVLKLSTFPFAYFMKKNMDSDSKYTIYARRLESDGKTKLLDPIGRALLPEQVKSHLQIRIPVLKLSLYMSLFPVQ